MEACTGGGKGDTCEHDLSGQPLRMKNLKRKLESKMMAKKRNMFWYIYVPDITMLYVGFTSW